MLEAESGDAGVEYHASNAMQMEGDAEGDEDNLGLSRSMSDEDMALFENADHSAPRSTLKLHVGDVCLLAKTIDKAAGLVKNKRVEIVELRWNSARVKLVSPDGHATYHTVGRCRFYINLRKVRRRSCSPTHEVPLPYS